ncbi:MAG: hypothetical protein JRI23_23945 [Deltaproteobacteria bacterium]|nr:hypothetical protein [Deltaproteobacteria bacterium]MBW2535045.1 hypothetical protein [Deltaproteobacteria bacterium]
MAPSGAALAPRALTFAVLWAAGCNALTGADAIDLERNGDPTGSLPDGGAAAAGGAGGAVSSQGAGGAIGGGGDEGPYCGNQSCDAGEDCETCPSDCGACAETCGNAACDPDETCVSCPADCGTCPPVCGNGTCESGEDCASCAADCGACGPVCGNGTCESGEDCASCAGDCGACPPTEVHVAGGDCNALQAGLDQSAAASLPLRLTGTFTVNCTVRIPSSVSIDGSAATFNFTKAGRIRNKTNGGGGGYTHAGGFVWDGGTFVGAGNGVFTISHSPGFTIRNTVQYAYAEDGDDGHGIEINSSGGRTRRTSTRSTSPATRSSA